ncbi:MAG: diguanylate cyclase domain-containing protein [Anaerovoracaceae bacterium]
MLIILRAEIISLIMLLFLLVSSVYYRVWNIRDSFGRMWLFAFIHEVFDIITVYTVNHTDTVPEPVNYICHMVFFGAAILFAGEYLLYIIRHCEPSEPSLKTRRVIMGLACASVLAVLLLPIEYLEGRGTNYSLGPSAIFGFGCAFLFLVASVVILLVRRKHVQRHVFYTLGPLTLLLIFMEGVQVMIPEYLFTGAVISLVMLGVFFSMENPSAVFRQQAVMDLFTGLQSRNSFEVRFQRMEEHYRTRELPEGHYGFVYCDVNDLKYVNDNLGHQTGDEYLTMIAGTLMKNLRSAQAHYRIGGDEFLSVYKDTAEEKICAEIEDFYAECRRLDQETEYPVSAAVGYEISGKKYASLRDVLEAADHDMYDKKWKMKNGAAPKSNVNGEELDLSGLTDRIFDAYDKIEADTYMYLTNLETNVSRWSASAVERFGLPGPYMYDVKLIWEEYVHPDDRERYKKDIDDVFSGRKSRHELTYRVKVKDGSYVTCICHGTILKGDERKPDLFAGFMRFESNSAGSPPD